MKKGFPSSKKQREYCGLICLSCGGVVYTTGPVRGEAFNANSAGTCNAHQWDSTRCSEGDLTFAFYHSHPDGNSFSGNFGDTGASEDYNVANFIRKRNISHYGLDEGGGYVAYNPGVTNITSTSSSATANVDFTSGNSAANHVLSEVINFKITIYE